MAPILRYRHVVSGIDPTAPLARGPEMQREAMAVMTAADALARGISRAARTPIAPQAPTRSARGFVRADTRVAGTGRSFSRGLDGQAGMAPTVSRRPHLSMNDGGSTRHYYRHDISRSFQPHGRRALPMRSFPMASRLLMSGSTAHLLHAPRVSMMSVMAVRAQAAAEFYGLSNRFSILAFDRQDGRLDELPNVRSQARGWQRKLAL